MTDNSGIEKKNVRLRNKILFPFFIILTLLGAGATVVSVLLITEALSKTADERLTAFQELIYREIKRQETLLGTHAGLLQSVLLPDGPSNRTLTTGDISTDLERALEEANIDITFHAASSHDHLEDEPFASLFTQAERSGKPRFRFIARSGEAPTLTVAAPLQNDHDDGVDDIVVLQSPIDSAFLRQLSAPFNTRTRLLNIAGETLAKSEAGINDPPLSREELEAVLNGQRIFKTSSSPIPYRSLYAAVPLGTTDLIILSLDLPMADLDFLINSLATGSVLAITLALLLGAYVYYRLIAQIMAPVHELMAATKAVSEGNLEYRIPRISRDELGEMASSFNDMMSRLGSLCRETIEQEKRLALAEEELNYKDLLEQKNREIENANRGLKAHLKELSALFQLNQAMISTLDINILFDRILQVLRDLMNCHEMVFLLYNPGADELVARRGSGPVSESLRDVTFKLNEGITGAAAKAQKLVYVRDIEKDERSLAYKGRMSVIGSMISAPLVVKNRLVGILNLHKEAIAGFSDTEINLIQAVANQAAIAIDNARLYEQARNLSNTDELTNLANRRHFQEILKREMAHAKRYHSAFCLAMVDIDHFKAYNDAHGHLMGDTVLRKVADILLANTRGIDLVGRFGGEEFIILLPKTATEGAWAAAEKLRDKVEQEVFEGADQSQPGGRLTLSIGVAEYPRDSKDVYALLDLADRALYQAKEEGRNRTVLWSRVASTAAS